MHFHFLSTEITHGLLTQQSNGIKHEANEKHVGVAQLPNDGPGEHQQRQARDAADRDGYAHQRARRAQVLQQPEQEALDVAPRGACNHICQYQTIVHKIVVVHKVFF